MPQDVPVQVGETYVVEATRLNDDGDGVGNVDGFTLFVPGLLPGESAPVTVTSIEKRFGRGRIEGELTRAHAAREVPLCHVFGACGGCQLQHVQYQEQLRQKRQMVEQALVRLGKFENVDVLPTLGMDNPWYYRNQVQVPLTYDESSRRLNQGFFQAGSHQIVQTQSCHLEPEAMERTVEAAVECISRMLQRDAGQVHHLIVRHSFFTQEQMLVLCVRDRHVIKDSLIEALSRIPGVVSIALTEQPRPHGPVWGKEVALLFGKSHITERVAGLEFLISPRSFFQVNTTQASALYSLALKYAAIHPNDTVLDAYCGTGTMTLLFAQHAVRALGIEVISSAIEDAKANATHNGIQNAEFVVGEVENVLPHRVRRGERFDVAVLDPPRKGCHPDVLQALIRAKPSRIVYVSCNHVTFARDARILADAGYTLGKVQPVDMFPQTSHVECCSLLVRKP